MTEETAKTPEEEAEEKARAKSEQARRAGAAGRGKGCGKGPRPNLDKRDERGVRKNTFNNPGGSKEVSPINPDLTEALCDMMKRGVFGEEDAEGGERVRNKGGRPTKIATVEELQEKTEAYIDYINAHKESGLMPDVEGYALWLHIDRNTIYDWVKTKPPAFSGLLKRMLNAIAAYKKQLAMTGKIPQVVFATDFNNNHGYTQTQKVEIEQPRTLDELPTKADIIKRLPTADEVPELPEIAGEN